MAELGINTVRTYTPPRRDLLDEAARCGLRVMVGLPWSQHVAFLDNRSLKREIRRELVKKVAELGDHPAVLAFALGNEIPPGVVRWHGRVRVENFLRSLYKAAKDASPASLLTTSIFRRPSSATSRSSTSVRSTCTCIANPSYVPISRASSMSPARNRCSSPRRAPTAFARGKPGRRTSRRCTSASRSKKARAARWPSPGPTSGGAAATRSRTGSSASWTPSAAEPAARAVSTTFASAPFHASRGANLAAGFRRRVRLQRGGNARRQPAVARSRLTYPNYEVILVNDGSKDRTSEIARAHPRVRVIDTLNQGLSAARGTWVLPKRPANRRLHRCGHAGGSRLADVSGSTVFRIRCRRLRRTPTWLPPTTHRSRSASRGSLAVRRTCCSTTGSQSTSPGATWRSAATPCSRSAASIRCISAPATMWTCAGGCRRGAGKSASRRLPWSGTTTGAPSRRYWFQQVGYGEGETWLMAHHPEKFLDGHMLWRGRIYSPLPFVRSRGQRADPWGTRLPSVYRADVHPFAFMPHSIRWQVISFVMSLAGLAVVATGEHWWAAALLLGSGLVGLAVTIGKNDSVRVAIGRRFSQGLEGLVSRRGGVSAFLQPLARLRGQIRGALSPPEVALPPEKRQTKRGAGRRRELACPAAGVRERHRRPVLERDLAVGRSHPRPGSRTGCAGRARCARSRSTKAGPTTGTSACSSAAGRGSTSVRSSKSTAAGKHSYVISTHLRPTTFGIGERGRSGHGAAGRRGHRRRAAMAAGGNAGRLVHPRAHPGGRLAHGADDGHRPPRHRAGHGRQRHGEHAAGTCPCAAGRAVVVADVRTAQRVPSSS